MDKTHLELMNIIESELSCPAHDIDHIKRVYNSLQLLTDKNDNVDMNILKASTILHDIARAKEDEDTTGSIDHAILGAQMAGDILTELNYSKTDIEKIKHCIETHRYRNQNKPQTFEAKLLFDADKLDVLGCIGIARSFIIAGKYGEKLFSDIAIDVYIQDNIENNDIQGRIKDISKHSPNIEFQTKLIHIPSKLYTEKGKLLAEERLKIMKIFFDRLDLEVSGKL